MTRVTAAFYIQCGFKPTGCRISQFAKFPARARRKFAQVRSGSFASILVCPQHVRLASSRHERSDMRGTAKIPDVDFAHPGYACYSQGSCRERSALNGAVRTMGADQFRRRQSGPLARELWSGGRRRARHRR